MTRTVDEQAEIVYQDAIDHPDGQGSLYKGNTGNVARELIKSNLSKDKIIEKLIPLIEGNIGFRHVGTSDNIIDLGAGGHRQTRHLKFKESFITFKQNDKFLSNANSIPWGEKGEDNAYHTVFR